VLLAHHPSDVVAGALSVSSQPWPCATGSPRAASALPSAMTAKLSRFEMI